ncbi:MAG: glutamate--tRNA ligase [Actinomycetota bacterium]|nr:glutamate--tRNA ligase [Actinomycetota bacterium]
MSAVEPLRQVRVRFAPAPSGSLHVGGARTALFNWLFARRSGGVFVLRLEDTDANRVTQEAVDILKDSLRWLGLEWDEGADIGGPHEPYRQTERLGLYRSAADELIAKGVAYPCFCTPEELEQRRKAATTRGEPPGYDGRCRRLTDAERRAFEAEGRPFALRFATPGRDVVVQDIVRGEARFPASDIKDFVILRSDGSPTYLLAAAVDDIRMEMTHVIRGEDLFSSTPRQMLIVEALGATPPAYAHLPLIVGADRQPLSKRHGSVAVEWFREQGFLPEALVNYLALLGWSLDEHTTFFSREELIRNFDLARVSHNPAAFDIEKLTWMNGHYIKELPEDDLAGRLFELLTQAGLTPDMDTLRAAVPLVNERMKLLADGVEMLRFLFVEEVVPNERAMKLIVKAGPEHFRLALEHLGAAREWTAEELTLVMTQLQERLNLSRTKAWQPIRAAVTGSDVSPPLPESLALLGRDRTLSRIRAALDLTSRPA